MEEKTGMQVSSRIDAVSKILDRAVEMVSDVLKGDQYKDGASAAIALSQFRCIKDIMGSDDPKVWEDVVSWYCKHDLSIMADSRRLSQFYGKADVYCGIYVAAEQDRQYHVLVNALGEALDALGCM